jgi:phage gp29-like protein
MSDDQVGSTANRLMNEVEAMEWGIKPGEGMKDDHTEMEYCKLAIQSLKDNGFEIEDIISQTLMPYFWGMSVFECLWDTSKKPWLPVKLQLKPVEWFKYDGENNLLFKSIYDPMGIPLTGPQADPLLKHQFFVLSNRATYENPYGDKALSKCLWPVTFKRGVLKFGMVFIERYGMPSLEIKHPPGYGEEQITKLVQSAALMIQDSVIAIPDGNTMNMHPAGEKQNGELYKLYIDMFDAMIEKVILSNTLATSQQSKGGYSSSETGKEIVEGLGERLKRFPRMLFDKLFRSVIDLNIGSKRYTKFTTFDENEPKKDFAEADKYISEAATASGQQLKRTKNFYINRVGYKDEEFELVDSAVPPVNQNNILPQFSEAELAQIPAVNIPDKLSQLLMEKVLQPVIDMIERNADRKSMLDELSKVFPKMDASDLDIYLTNLIFIYVMVGHNDAQQENKKE